MKSKVLTSLGIVVIAMALFLNSNVILDNNTNLTLASLLAINTANAETDPNADWCKKKCDSNPNYDCGVQVTSGGVTYTLTCHSRKTKSTSQPV